MTNKEKQRAVRVLLDKYDKKHLANLLRRKKVIDDLYNSVSREAARIGVACPFDDPDKPFYLDDYPATKARVDDLMEDFIQDLEVTIAEGSKEEWLLSASKNAAMIDILAKGTGIPKETLNQWKEPNLDALKAFQERKEKGFNLSKRVWDLGQQTKSQLELAMDVGLGQGKSAAELSRDVRQYLKEPNKLFRRVRDKEGNLRLSKNAQTYHPGQGVYRSSYKNALRMTATENNMAYRTADHEKWNNLDFVIGYEIALSNNHTLNGKPFEDICDDLAGEYPKDFKFTGWHPFCRCIVTPVLADWNEVLKQMDSDNPKYSGEIKDMPKEFDKWVENNKERIEKAKSLPYFIKDNSKYIERITGLNITNIKVTPSMEEWMNTLSVEEQKEIMSQLHNGVSPSQVTNGILNGISHSVYDYAEKYKDRYPSVKDLLNKVNNEKDPNKKIQLINDLKEQCAVVTKFDLEYVKAVNDNLTYVGTKKNYTMQQKASYFVNGKTINIEEKKYDLVVYKDKYGIEYMYPIGIDVYKIPYKASKASEYVKSMHGYMRKNFKGILFADSYHPIDAYYQEIYKNFTHGAMYSGEPITVHFDYNLYDDNFKRALSHEIGHHIDDKLKMRDTWKKVIDADNNQTGKYIEVAIRDYSKNSILEDIADSWSLWINDRDRLKREFPNRYEAIKKSIKAANK